MKNDHEELRLIQEAFSQLDSKRSYFKDMHRMYEARYANEELQLLNRNNYNHIYVPMIRNIINTIVGHFNTAFFSGKNPIEVRAINAKDNERISGINRVINYYYNICNPQEELLKAIRGALVYGFACVYIHWDNIKNKVETKYMPINSVALDPYAMSIQEAQYVCVKLHNTYEYFYSIFGDKINSLAPTKKTELLELQQIYIKHLDGYEKKSFIKNICVEKIDRIQTLPFCYGYAMQRLNPPDEHQISNTLLWLGDCLPRLLSSMQAEMNKKRNLKMDLDENRLNPKGVYTDDFPAEILQQGPGSIAKTSPNATFTPIISGNDIDIGFDIELINKEAEEASGVNSIHMGRTTTSDRRSATSLAIINSSSSVRIEEMITTINNTLFEHWSKQFVRLVVKHAPLDIQQELEANTFIYSDIATTLKINFGSSFAVSNRIASLTSILQMVSQNPNFNPEIIESILSEILTLELGDSYDVSKIFETEQKKQAQNQAMGLI